MQQANFLVEIHTEELPPKTLLQLAKSFMQHIETQLLKAELPFAEIKFFATPRRLAVYIKDLSEKQQDKVTERKGPALDRAYDASGNPTQACIGFAKSCNTEINQLITLKTAQGDFVGFKQAISGKTVSELMPDIVSAALAALPVAKPMRWGNHNEKFVRPVHSVIMLYGDKVIDTTIVGCKTGNKTRGHRLHGPNSEWIEIKSPDTYENQLDQAGVIADFEKRKQNISIQVEDIANEKGMFALVDKALLDEVTSLVEWPVAVCGNFDASFLAVPQEALISAMQDHQRYFAMMDKDNKLLPHFITISNIESKEPQRVIAGNERVLRARLSDAAFFFDTDKKVTLESRVEKLKTIIFQNKLGTLFDKTVRVQKLAGFIAKQLGDEPKHAERAAFLSKTDLTTDLVGEFPELQGIAGYYYALNDKETKDVAIALNEQYMPRFSGDVLPTTKLACALALADRLDTLVGVFGINQAPTGDKDPFGLRRSALGVLRILIEKQYNLDLRELISFAASNFSSLVIPTKTENKSDLPWQDKSDDTLTFILERLKPWYQEQQVSSNVIASVMTLNLSKPYDIHCRIQAVVAFKNLPEAESLSVANKRVSNILAKYDTEIISQAIQENLFESDAERELVINLQLVEKDIAALSNSADYQKVLSQLAHLRVPVDNFFDHVLVMADDKAQRENRLLMLKKLRELFLHVADIALLQ